MSSPKLRNRKANAEQTADASVDSVDATKVEDTPKTDVAVVDSVALDTIWSMGVVPYVKRKSASCDLRLPSSPQTQMKLYADQS